MSTEPTDRIAGSYPGGPRRHQDQEPHRRSYRPESAEERTARIHDGAWSRKRRKRLKRIVIGLFVVFVAAAAVGIWTGLSAHRSSEEIAAEAEVRGETLQDVLTGERRRVLQELWRMEALEAAPRSGGTP